MRRKTEIVDLISNCILCGSPIKQFDDPQLKVTYSHCESCDFLYKQQTHHLSKEAEKEQYDYHNNSMENEGYVAIFKNLKKDYIEPLKITGNILEYGSGPGPVLYQLLAEDYQNVYHYDPFYHPDEAYQNKTYQLITSTEVVEHFFDPIAEFDKLVTLLDEKGYLLIMTNFREMNREEFLTWWYRRDSTHVAFYSLHTMQYLARRYNLSIVTHNSKNIILFQK